MNTNLKIALLLGYTFTRHGWVAPQGLHEAPLTDEDIYNRAFKVWDNDDYNYFAYNDAESLLRVLNTIEQKYCFELEFMRQNNLFTLVKINRPVMNAEKQRGTNETFTAPVTLTAPTLVNFIRGFFHIAEFPGIEEKMAEVQKEYNWHYVGIKHAKADY